MDRTTLTRNAGPLRRKGLLRIGAGSDRRSSAVEITDRGHAVLARAYPLWRETQRRIISRLGRRRWESLIGALADLKAAARA
jgi:DNA-binding MarR family transcriptional regulator